MANRMGWRALATMIMVVGLWTPISAADAAARNPDGIAVIIGNANYGRANTAGTTGI